MRNLLTLVLPFVLCLVAARSGAAQCAPIPGTGCPGQNAPICGTPPVIGTNFSFRCAPSCFPSTAQFLIIGTPIPAVTLPSPPMCVPGCVLGCQPLVAIAAPGLTIAIPNNPALIGFMLCIQCACQPSGAACLNLTQATMVTIM